MLHVRRRAELFIDAAIECVRARASLKHPAPHRISLRYLRRDFPRKNLKPRPRLILRRHLSQSGDRLPLAGCASLRCRFVRIGFSRHHKIIPPTTRPSGGLPKILFSCLLPTRITRGDFNRATDREIRRTRGRRGIIAGERS